MRSPEHETALSIITHTAMYTEYFGLKEAPFAIAPDPQYLYMSPQHREALAHLIYGVYQGGFVLLTGEVGTGKTTLCRCLLEQLPETADIAFVINPKLTVVELLATICDEFGIPYRKDMMSFKELIDRLNRYLLTAHAKGRNPVLIIDEAQHLSAEVLEHLRLLTNLETNDRKLLQILMIGQPELGHKLQQPELRQLAQRITARFHLGPLSKGETADYVAHRLQVADADKRLFSPGSVRALHRLSQGIPRLVNMICDRALLGAYVQRDTQVSPATLKRAAREVMGTNTRQVHSTARMAAGTLAGLVLLGAGAVFTAGVHSPNHWQQYILGLISPDPMPGRAEPDEPTSANGEPPADPPPSAPKTVEKDAGSALATNGSVSDEPTELDWPPNLPRAESEALAYQALLARWGLPLREANATRICQQVQTHGLQCLQASGNLELLRRLDRPAVLELVDDKGASYYAALVGLAADTVTLAVGEMVLKRPSAVLNPHWLGDYTLLWRAPPAYQGLMPPGHEGPLVPWLREKLALAMGNDIPLSLSLRFEGTLVRQVRQFQSAHGLVADGVVGPHTIIHLNSAHRADVPRLLEVPSDD